MVVGSFSNFSVKLCLLALTEQGYTLYESLTHGLQCSQERFMISHNILLLSLKTSGEIKWFQLHNKRVVLFQRQTEFKMLEIIELLCFLLFQSILMQ